MSGNSRELLKELSGKSVQVTIKDFNIVSIFQVEDNEVKVISESREHVDCTISATLLSFIRMAVVSSATDGAFDSKFEMRGDLETGKQFRDLLAKAEIDWEEMVSRYTGDVVAHQLGNSVRSLRKWGADAAYRLGLDMAEYLQEESRQLPTRVEIDLFIKDIDELRLSVDRAEARINRLLENNAGVSRK